LTAAGSNILQIDNFMTSGNASDKTLGGIMIVARLLVGCHGTVLLMLTLSRESFSRAEMLLYSQVKYTFGPRDYHLQFWHRGNY
jgi:hypothetical protein